MQRIWVTGYRSFELNIFGSKDKKIPIIEYALTTYFKRLLEDGQLDWVISGPNMGVEQWALNSAISLRDNYDLHVSLMTPYLEFDRRWNETNKNNFNKIKNEVDFFASTSNSIYKSPLQLKNYQNFMIKHTDRALLVYDSEHPGKTKYDYNLIKKYQEQNCYKLDLIDFYDLQDAAQEYSDKYNSKFY